MQDVADVTLRRSCEGILNPEQQGESGTIKYMFMGIVPSESAHHILKRCHVF